MNTWISNGIAYSEDRCELLGTEVIKDGGRHKLYRAANGALFLIAHDTGYNHVETLYSHDQVHPRVKTVISELGTFRATSSQIDRLVKYGLVTMA